MNLPGLITIQPDQPETLKHAARVIGEAFMEENWFLTWMSALDAIGATEERKRELVVASFEGSFEMHAPYQAVYATEDLAGIAGAYLASEFSALGAPDHEDLEERGSELRVEPLLTPEESRLLSEQAERMAPISDFSWAADHAEGADHIYFFAWAVDSSKRGSGAFRRLITPFFDYADKHGINCYLECYSDSLQSLYEHVGFELIDVLSDPQFEVTERRMVRRPR